MAESKYTRQTVTAVRTWVENKLFSLRVSRDPAFSFQPGQFARLGLADVDTLASGEARPTLPQSTVVQEPSIWRAYSMVSSPQDPELEFYSIVVPGGEFSSRLANLREGDSLYVDKTAFGFLTLERFSAAVDPGAGHPAAGDPGAGHPAAGAGELWLVASGTGLSAYLSILRESEAWERFAHVIVVHGVRHLHELAYREEIESMEDLHPGQLTYLPIATRETVPGMPQARLTQLMEDGRLEALAGQRLNPSTSKIMLCGNPAMLADARKLLGKVGFAPGRRGIPGNLAVENYW